MLELVLADNDMCKLNLLNFNGPEKRKTRVSHLRKFSWINEHAQNCGKAPLRSSFIHITGARTRNRKHDIFVQEQGQN